MIGRPSITRRIALLFGIVSAGGFLALGAYLSAALEAHFVEIDQETLQATATRIERVFAQGVETANTEEAIHRRLDALIAGHDRVSYWIHRQNGDLVVADAPSPFPKQALDGGPGAGHRIGTTPFKWEDQGHAYRGLAFQVTNRAGEPLNGVVALSTAEQEHCMTMFRHALWWAVAGAILSAILLGALIARSAMRPVQSLTSLAQRVSTRHLGDRLDTANTPQELFELATAFNEMLDRLDDSFRRLSNFSSDIAHELRTPLSNLLTETQVTLARSRSADEYRDVLASNAEELERMARMVADMLFLAKADNGLILPQPEAVDLRREVEALVEFFEPLAEEREISFTVAGQATVVGDRLMLRRALSNLLSNATHYSPPGGGVSVTLATAAGTASVAIDNSGTPIREEDRRRLFDRFFRADPSRTPHGEGAGLGLAITHAIVTAHDGSIEMTSLPKGNRFTIHLPLDNPSKPAKSVTALPQGPGIP